MHDDSMRDAGKDQRRPDTPFRIPMLIGGRWTHASEHSEIRDPYRGGVVSHAPQSSLADLDAALTVATAAKRVMAACRAISGRHFCGGWERCSWSAPTPSQT